MLNVSMAISTMNLADPELELMDPTPNIQTLFVHFDQVFFWTKLTSRAVVRWSKRMYSCAGICSYEGRGGLCDIALSEPLLKLRPRKDLVETLLHEMIHAFLFVTNRDQDRDGHGPNFKAHMHRINKSAGLNISIYHDFHDEVKLYQTHWWRCNGPCQTRRPHFGIVRRSMNKAPGPTDFWWNSHKRQCGGTFIKIKEPEKKIASKKSTRNKTQKNIPAKPNADITKYINSNIKTINNLLDTNNSVKPVLKDSNIIKPGTKTKSNSSNTVVVSKKGVVFNPTGPKTVAQPLPVFTGTGYSTNNNKHITDSSKVTEHVRNIWANKQIPQLDNKLPIKKLETNNLFKKPGKVSGVFKPSKHKAESTDIQSPPAKVKKIDDFFKANASLVLKDLYGEDFKLTETSSNTKLVAVSVKEELVACPVCNKEISSKNINRHLDECLNKEVIEKLSKDNSDIVQEVKPSQSNIDNNQINQKMGDVRQIPTFKGTHEHINNTNVVDLINLNNYYYDNFFDFDIPNATNTDTNKQKTAPPVTLESVGMNKVSALVKQNSKPGLSNIRRSDSFITKVRGDTDIIKIKPEPHIDNIKQEPGPSKQGEPYDQVCPCCGERFRKSVEEHLDECLVFFNNNSTIPSEGTSTSYSNNTTIVIDDEEDDIFDESQVFNATGTKTPCPCCMKMVEEADMNDHLDICLESS